MTRDIAGERLAQCEGKKGYDTKAAALATARHGRGDIRTYRCDFCRKWHNGHGRGK